MSKKKTDPASSSDQEVERDGKGRFRKGQSGNPAGRRSEVTEIQKLLREAAPEAVEKLLEVLRGDGSDKDKIAAARVIISHTIPKPKPEEKDTADRLVELVKALKE